MKKSIVAFLLAFTVSIISYSQVTFSGKVLDENNVPLPGASVVVKGSSNGVATDFDGNFEIELPKGDEILVVSYIGYISQDLQTAGKSSATVVMQPDSQL
ncbi:MAG: carboxypeptidase-like regulatory domain-containing protein, partial [Bacteroidota bacterium]|nr:carboxypeptidase-like regulatory domain-containing protein [Bacteroidota bacterium]